MKIRKFCGNCKKFEFHIEDKCEVCGTVYNDESLSLASKEDLVTQSFNYIKSIRARINGDTNCDFEQDVLSLVNKFEGIDKTLKPTLDIVLKAKPVVNQFKREYHLLSVYERLMQYQRNDKCPCGSGKKVKHCCLKNFNSYSPIKGRDTLILLKSKINSIVVI